MWFLLDSYSLHSVQRDNQDENKKVEIRLKEKETGRQINESVNRDKMREKLIIERNLKVCVKV